MTMYNYAAKNEESYIYTDEFRTKTGIWILYEGLYESFRILCVRKQARKNVKDQISAFMSYLVPLLFQLRPLCISFKKKLDADKDFDYDRFMSFIQDGFKSNFNITYQEIQEIIFLIEDFMRLSGMKNINRFNDFDTPGIINKS